MAQTSDAQTNSAESLALIFQSLLNSQNQMVEQLRLLTTQQPAASAAPQVNVSPFENYVSGKEKFSQYLARFEHYLKLKNVTDDKQKVHLLSTSVGSEHYNNLAVRLQGQKEISDLGYKDLTEYFTQLLTKKRSEVVAKLTF